jgi:flagellar biosynthesis GTPase FlhF
VDAVQFQNFRGSDVTEALSQVRNVLGPDAVIRATRRVKGGGPLDHGYVEIEAAAGEPSRKAVTIESASNQSVRRATFARVPERRQTPMPGSTRGAGPASSRANLGAATRPRSPCSSSTSTTSRS